MSEDVHKQIKVFMANSENDSPAFLVCMREVWNYRDLLLALVRREIAIRYKQSILGVAWALFAPLMMMIIFSIIFTKVHKIDTGGIPYPIFAYCGLLPWIFFQTSIAEGTNSLTMNVNLVTKVYFPKSVFPLAIILSKLVDLALGLVVLGGLMIYFNYTPHLSILLVPLVLFVQILFMTGLLMFLSMGNLFFRDVKMIVPVVLLLWMFASNVIWPIPTSETFGWVLAFLNPMVPFLEAYRSLILEGTLTRPELLGAATAISVLMLFLGVSIFQKYEYLFAERI